MRCAASLLAFVVALAASPPAAPQGFLGMGDEGDALAAVDAATEEPAAAAGSFAQEDYLLDRIQAAWAGAAAGLEPVARASGGSVRKLAGLHQHLFTVADREEDAAQALEALGSMVAARLSEPPARVERVRLTLRCPCYEQKLKFLLAGVPPQAAEAGAFTTGVRAALDGGSPAALGSTLAVIDEAAFRSHALAEDADRLGGYARVPGAPRP